jgi:DNA polymerase-1
MIRVAEAMRAERLAAAMILQVHDELVFEVPSEEIDAMTTLVRHQMEGAARLAVPLVVDIGVGANWLETKFD